MAGAAGQTPRLAESSGICCGAGEKGRSAISVAGFGRDAALEQLEATLRGSLLAREELLAGAHVSESERRWLKKHRSKEARDWNVLSNWRPEALRYVA